MFPGNTASLQGTACGNWCPLPWMVVNPSQEREDRGSPVSQAEPGSLEAVQSQGMHVSKMSGGKERKVKPCQKTDVKAQMSRCCASVIAKAASALALLSEP